MNNNIRLSFINTLGDQENIKIVFFQKNTLSKFHEDTVAWKVIKPTEDTYNFNFPLNLVLNVVDSTGKTIHNFEIQNSGKYNLCNNSSGFFLEDAGLSKNKLEVYNKTLDGAVSFNILRDNKLLNSIENIFPGKRAAFQFNTSLWVGMVSNVSEGEKMNTGIISRTSTELNLKGISSANIVMMQKHLSSDIMFALKEIVYN